MKLRISAAMVTLALLSACGGGGGEGTGTVDGTPVTNPIVDDRNNNPTPIIAEDRTRPAGGAFSSDDTELKSNGADPFSDTGAQRVESTRVVSWPGLRYGDFLVSNNPWNASAANYPLWFQDISLYNTGSGWGVKFDWDWGAANDTNGSQFNTKSYPEVIYGVKSAGEISGSFAETGLPVEIFDSPVFTIDYNFSYEGRRSESPTAGGTDSEFNVAIESFYHDSCNIVRNGGADDNQVFEAMVWLKLDERNPSGGAAVGEYTTSDGRTYDVYTKLPSNPAYIAFVSREQSSDGDVLNGTVLYSELLNHAQDNAAQYGIYPLKSTDCLANILMGTEIWHGAGTFNLNNYQIHRSY